MTVSFKRILVPTDFSKDSDDAVRYALSIASLFHSEVHLVHVIEDFSAFLAEPGVAVLPTQEILDSLLAGAKSRLDKLVAGHKDAGIPLVVSVLQGISYHEITQYASEHHIDMIVMGTHGRTGFSHLLLGSVAERVVRSAPCAVLTVRHPDHLSAKSAP